MPLGPRTYFHALYLLLILMLMFFMHVASTTMTNMSTRSVHPRATALSSVDLLQVSFSSFSAT